ncbi:hypothetical protein L593_04600 [Salinarchaeum sp. Harcht-Bsk1]|uniref:hypothetical protein n=1 Tax=Salinarchaeum sp. Harcht-Bsk1 TaxID=1333523 RepID=UPI0003423035|nr:hypothetical protein [Salinarchaeum sp. Harcht-Bsk1]AGN00869.1 hypothetical protein L593_04600 [Salinarchaeum sp. Harcht-Bsk1]
MTTEEPSVTSKDALNEELKALLRTAYENGVDVEGGFECRNGVEHPDWDVIVTEVEKNEHPE